MIEKLENSKNFTDAEEKELTGEIGTIIANSQRIAKLSELIYGLSTENVVYSDKSVVDYFVDISSCQKNIAASGKKLGETFKKYTE